MSLGGVILYAADHGEMLGDHGLMAKMNFYKSSVRIPLIVRPPGGSDARVHDGPVQAIDLAATMLDAAGTSQAGIPARTLGPLTEDAKAHRDIALSMIRLRPGSPTWLGVTDGETRATFDHESGDVVEVFDLVGDPDEAHNLSETAPTAEVDRLRGLAQAALTGG